MSSIFSYVCSPSVYLLWRNVCLGLLPIFWFFFFFVLSYISSLYILEINPLLVASFANIFSQSVGCLFILLMVSFAVLKLISLIWLGLSLSLLKISFALGDYSKKTLLWFISENVLCVFSSRNFMVADLM